MTRDMNRTSKLSALTAFAVATTGLVSSPATAAIYYGDGESAVAMEVGSLDWTFTGEEPTAPFQGHDLGLQDELISESKFFDGTFNHSANPGFEPPIGATAEWGSQSHRAEWVLDMKETYTIVGITMHAGSGNTWWGMLQSEFAVSDDGINWTPIGEAEGRRLPGGQLPAGETWVREADLVTGATGRYLRLTAVQTSYSSNAKLDEMDLYIVPEPASVAMIFAGCGLILCGRARSQR